jgi:hypothetical protein
LTGVLPPFVAAGLLIFAGAHLTLLGSLLLRRPRSRALVGLLVPPLVPYWGWQSGLRTRVYVWAAALAVYALGVCVLALS